MLIKYRRSWSEGHGLCGKTNKNKQSVSQAAVYLPKRIHLVGTINTWITDQCINSYLVLIMSNNRFSILKKWWLYFTRSSTPLWYWRLHFHPDSLHCFPIWKYIGLYIFSIKRITWHEFLIARRKTQEVQNLILQCIQKFRCPNSTCLTGKWSCKSHKIRWSFNNFKTSCY